MLPLVCFFVWPFVFFGLFLGFSRLAIMTEWLGR